MKNNVVNNRCFFICKIRKLKLPVCLNLADVVCAIGIYELSVLIAGGGVVVTRQSGQILSELRAEWRGVGHTVTRHKETELLIISTNLTEKTLYVARNLHSLPIMTAGHHVIAEKIAVLTGFL